MFDQATTKRRPSDDQKAFQGEADHPLSHELDCELIIGLVAAVGTELEPLTTFLTEQLALAGYETKSLKISSDCHRKTLRPYSSGNKVPALRIIDDGGQ